MCTEKTQLKCPKSNEWFTQNKFNIRWSWWSLSRFVHMPDDEFHWLFSTQDAVYSALFSNALENNNWPKYCNFECAKISCGEGTECLDEAIQSIRNLKYFSTV